jgi:hypothetical protein
MERLDFLDFLRLPPSWAGAATVASPPFMERLDFLDFLRLPPSCAAPPFIERLDFFDFLLPARLRPPACVSETLLTAVCKALIICWASSVEFIVYKNVIENKINLYFFLDINLFLIIFKK